jgi:calcium-binding protein CML
MDRLDLDRDGKITETEIYKALSSVSGEKGAGYGATLAAENTLRKIAGGAKNYTNMADYVKDLIRKFDRNNDGLLTMQELTTGLTKIGITLNNNEVQALMNRLDLNRDGEVSGEELLNVLKRYDTRQISNPAVDKIVQKLVEGGSRFPSMRDYARHLIKTFDRDSDGIITFNELCDGLLKMKIVVTQNEKKGLMDRLDIDRDGKITETEMFRVLLSADTSVGDHASNFAADQTIKKIADGATKFGGSLSQYVKDLVRKFDRNSDGLLTI